MAAEGGAADTDCILSARGHSFVDVSRCVPAADTDANVDASAASSAAAARYPDPVDFDNYSRFHIDAPAVKFGERIEEETRTVRQNLRLLRALIDDPSAPLSPWSYDVLHFFDSKGGARGGFPPLGTNLCCYPLAQLASEWVDVGLPDPTLVVVGREARCPAGFEWVSDEDALLRAGENGECVYPACSHAQEPPCDEEWDCDDASLGEDRVAPPPAAGEGRTLVFSVCTDEELDAFGEGGGGGGSESGSDAGDSGGGGAANAAAASAKAAPSPAQTRSFSFPPRTSLLNPDGPPMHCGGKRTAASALGTTVSVFPRIYLAGLTSSLSNARGSRTSSPSNARGSHTSSPSNARSVAERRPPTTLNLTGRAVAAGAAAAPGSAREARR